MKEKLFELLPIIFSGLRTLNVSLIYILLSLTVDIDIDVSEVKDRLKTFPNSSLLINKLFTLVREEGFFSSSVDLSDLSTIVDEQNCENFFEFLKSLLDLE